MTEIITNYGVEPVKTEVSKVKSLPQKFDRSKPRKISHDEFWRREKRKNSGWIERLYNSIKNVTGLGVGSKKVEKALQQVKNQEISVQEFKNIVKGYNSSQESSAQLLGDAFAVAFSIPVFFMLHKQGNLLASRIKLNEKNAKTFIEDIFPKEYADKVLNTAKSNKKMLAIITALTALNAGYMKMCLLSLNSIGSPEYKVDEKIYGKKSQRTKIEAKRAKAAKRQNNKNGRNANLKNFVSGAINGLMLPVMLLGGVIGVPLFIIGNSLTRYFVGSKQDKNKSVEGYINNLTNEAVTTGLVTAGLAVPLFKKGNYIKVFNENLKKATDVLSKAKLEKPDYADKSALSELEDALYSSDKVSEIINGSMSIDEQIKQLTKENIFAVKFKQISNDGSSLTEALRENCPATRTVEQAQKFIDEKMGKGYKISKILGVGTIAETYLAKTTNGKDVCLKVLKEGISEEKILKDKEKFVEIVKNMKDKTEEEKAYLLKNVDDLSNGVLKEVDFQNEMKAAKELVPYTKVAKVVEPIEVKNGVYVMEKAEGISLSSLVDLNEAKLYRETLENGSTMSLLYQPSNKSNLGKLLKDKKTKEEKLETINAYIKKIEARTPEFGNIDLKENDVNYLIREYMKVLVEQFTKVEKDGKVLHADIHPGNVFIDVNALRNKKGKIFTLIDTGNTIKQTQAQSMRAVNLTSYIKHANVPDLAEYVLEGAILPKNLSKEEAVKKLTEELNKCFFDDKTTLERMTNENFLILSSNIMRKYDILPSDTQLNLFKARRSADNSLANMIETLLKIKLKDVTGTISGIGTGIGFGKDIALMMKKFNKLKSVQEKENLKLLTKEQAEKQKNNTNNLKTNSEKYLIYKLKQSMI